MTAWTSDSAHLMYKGEISSKMVTKSGSFYFANVKLQSDTSVLPVYLIMSI